MVSSPPLCFQFRFPYTTIFDESALQIQQTSNITDPSVSKKFVRCIRLSFITENEVKPICSAQPSSEYAIRDTFIRIRCHVAFSRYNKINIIMVSGGAVCEGCPIPLMNNRLVPNDPYSTRTEPYSTRNDPYLTRTDPRLDD